VEARTVPIPILTTKLHPPQIRPDILPRARLMEMLDTGRERPLTLISAPAGYGKSTLVSRWLASRDESHAWLSLDDTDNDLRVFANYLVAAVRTVVPEACSQTMAMLTDAARLPVAQIAGQLVNELADIDTHLRLVLDDYHRITESAVHELLGAVLRNPPPRLHLVIATRRDPPLPIAQMLAQGRATEVRLRDLKFTTTETKALLEHAINVAVSDPAVANVQTQLEGWIAGLHLVLLNLRHQHQPDEFLRTLRGGTSRVQAYLLGEVLSRQSPAVQDWLVKTSSLDRFCAALCDAVCQRSQQPGETELDGETFVRALDVGNLFCIPLDEHGEWYRYHHLFQKLLLERLRQDYDAQEIGALHSRASAWFESHGLVEEAIRHALAAGNVARAAGIVEDYRNDEFIADRWYNVERWLAMLPTEIKREHPRLLLTEAWIANLRHQLSRVPMILERVEAFLPVQAPDPIVSGELAFFRGYFEYFGGQVERSRQHLEEAASRLSDTKSPFLSEAELMLGLARCMAGQSELAVRALEARIDELDSADSQLVSRLVASLVFIHLVCGDMTRARVDAQRLQSMARNSSMRLTEAWSSYMLGCTHLHAAELEAAERHFADAVGQRYVLEPMAANDALAGLALTQQLLRQDEEAASTLERLQEFALELNERQQLSAAHSCRARLALLRGDSTFAVRWARTADDPPTPATLFMWLEVPAVTRARVLITAGSDEDLGQAIGLLLEIRQQTEACRLTCQTIEVAVLQSLALAKQGSTEEALGVLEEAVALAEPGGWIRPFIELGPAMADLLGRLQKRNAATAYVRQILTALREVKQGRRPEPSQSPSSRKQALLEPLTNREAEILELLVQRLRDKEIAERLFVSPATVNTHLKHIYEKLRVRNRREAVAKAKDLGILPRP
jgi:LuxR family maltose regulon positive regulatory protein